MTQPAKPEPVNLSDFEAAARERLSPTAYDYYASGAGDEITLRENHAAFDRIQLLPRVLVDVSHRDLSTTVLSRPTAMPVMIAPTAFHRLACPEGELATARAAAEMGIVMVLSTLSNVPLEEVAQVGPSPRWFQLYIYRDRGVTRSLVERAEASGYQALCVTVDAPLLGRRERDVRNRFSLPPDLAVANLLHYLPKESQAEAPQSALNAYFARLMDQSVTWDDLDWLRGITSLPVVPKGIHHPEDARLAVEHGVPAIVVSNHGGRQLDTAPATIDLLPAIADAVQGRAEILLDGGVRRGTDVIKALALGARAVLIGRPVLWGLAVDGQRGAERVLRLLQKEIDLAMALCGLTKVSDITSDLARWPH
ncbi:MAG: alpha-hydroxy-acid oxidizing protein [Chloroflexi bacterium]|nr:alpha-hydroxy-acid oxidizing protein [Chloroflexota bacterium]